MTDEIEDIPPPQVDWYIKVTDIGRFDCRTERAKRDTQHLR